MSSINSDNQIIKAIRNHKRGKIFFPKNFSKFGSSEAIRKTLERVEQSGLLIRLAHGIYLYPKVHPKFGVLQPTLDEIATAIAKRDRARIIPTGVQAMNKLGLSTQVPMNAVYLTDGSPRIVKIGKRKIKFKIASPKLLSAKSETSILVIQAMREIGEDKFGANEKKIIREVLFKIDKQQLEHDLKLAPVWIQKELRKILNEKQ